MNENKLPPFPNISVFRRTHTICWRTEHVFTETTDRLHALKREYAVLEPYSDVDTFQYLLTLRQDILGTNDHELMRYDQLQEIVDTLIIQYESSS